MIFLAFFAQVAVWINHSSFIPIASPVWNGALEVHFSGWEFMKLKAGDLPPMGVPTNGIRALKETQCANYRKTMH